MSSERDSILASSLGDGVMVTLPHRPSCLTDWWKDAVVYQIFPDRFAPDPAGLAPGTQVDAWGSPPTIRSFQGGSLRGITANLDHIQSLGVNTLYTTPVFLSTANHRYHPSDFMKVDPMLGGEDAFRELVDACHARGMRFVLDGVFNHTGRGHWAFCSLLDAQEQSPYRDWFLPKSFPVVAYGVERYNVNYECWWDLPDLPKLNFKNEGVREHVLDVGAHWVREFGIDGWRLDYPIEIEPAFWRRFRDRCRAEKESCVTVGELFGVRPDDVGEDGHFDSLMNYAFGTCAVGFVGGGVELRQDDAIGGDYHITPVDADGFRRAYGEVCRAYQSAHVPGTGRDARGKQNALGSGSAHPAMLMNLFDSHDTARALWMLRGDAEALKLLLLMQACVPGPPMIYQGTEVGQIGALGLDGSGRDPHNRQAFPWHESAEWDRNLLEHTRAIGRLRNENVALRRGGLRWRDASRLVSGRDPLARRRVGPIFRLGPRRRDAPLRLSRGRERSGPTRVRTGFAPGTDLGVLHGEDDISMFAAGCDGRTRRCVVVDVPRRRGSCSAPPATVPINDENSFRFHRGARGETRPREFRRERRCFDSRFVSRRRVAMKKILSILYRTR